MKFNYLPIGYKLMLSYLVFIIILVSVNGYVTHSMYDSSMREQTRGNIQGTLTQIRDNVAYKTDDMVRISSTLYDEASFVDSLKRRVSGKENNIRMEQVLLPKLESASKSIGVNLRLSVYLHNETIDERYYVYKNGNKYDDIQTYNIYWMSRILSADWYTSLPAEEHGVTMAWKQVEEDADGGRISMIRRIVDLSDPLHVTEMGVMRFSVPLDELFESVDYRKLGDGAMLMVKDRAGRLIYSSGGPPSDDLSGSYLTIENRMQQQDWTITAYVPLTIIKQEAERVRAFIIGVCVVCFVLFTFAGAFISRYFSKRVTKFVSVLNSFREGDLHRRITYRGKDEFSQIAVALNGMGEDVESLIHKVYLTQLQKKEAELEMLQTQINPHFLYNTLSSINRLAKFGENEKLQKMVVQLAKFYRLSLNSGRTLIPIHAEIEQSNAYLDIQKVKYGQRLEVTYDVDPAVWPYETIKLILQPFIENVLKHAWSGDRIHIRIVVKLEEGDILYRIIDDGLGVRGERIRDMMSGKNDNESGYGIRNIHQRVQLQYGAEYGVSIFSRVGVGTSVTIRIPARKRRLFARGEETAG
ncbi:cache domain-containing sensor histidine kinase [Paenibacillus soyae]|uniref:Sensor histidine kinase n=1 Tax=Paenibacillus soyae TaxID=2969249 RepID=A0A9X2MP45_9BACL|nr:sensor histidine kinase [Paenibacillus soyae]MCR2804324.1 sensor histidine kinase [Paenibacillus soyae]